ncbi:MAG: ParB/RepB/Spo0J family partition protein [Ancrocorticia sp.]|uniref:ParB/RepB/Spo0J family partition protein n=1 Tax=Ancrocorticia sp. TaxID=2593684 RepID=UPI003F9248BA
MAERRRGLGRGIGALIPDSQRESKERPIDVFFGGQAGKSGAEAESAGLPGVSSTETLADDTSAEVKPDALVEEEAANTAAQPATANAHQAEVPKKRAGGESTSKKASTKKPSAKKPSSDITSNEKSSSKKIRTSKDDVRRTATDDAGTDNTGTDDAGTDKAGVDQNTPTVGSGKNAAAAAGSVRDRGASQTTPDGEAGKEADEGLVAVPGASYAELPLEEIIPNQRQPRSVFDEDELEELAASIKEVGVLQPIIVRPLTEPVTGHPEVAYELIMGERRWRAAQKAGDQDIPAIVRRTADEDLLRDALLENLHRAELNPLEEAAAYQQLLEDFHCTQEELAKRIARSRPQITNTLRLMKLPPLVQRRVAAHVLSAGHARALLGLSDPAGMERLAQRIVAEGLSVRQVEEIVAMGEESEAPAPRVKRAHRFAPQLSDLSGELAERFDTRVKVNMGLRKGSIKIDFGSIEDLNRILDVMAPEIATVDVDAEQEQE